METEKTTGGRINTKYPGERRNGEEVLREREREEGEGKMLKNKSLSRRDLASHPPTITAPHVRHCEGRKNKNDKEMEKGKKEQSGNLNTLLGENGDFRGPSGQRSQSSNIVKWNVCGVE